MHARQMKRIMGKTEWYEKRPREEDANEEGRSPRKRMRNSEQKRNKNYFEDPASVIFIQRTQGGKLASQLRELEPELFKITQGKVKVVEKNGTKLEDILIRNNPWASEACSRPGCTVCQQDSAPKNPACRRRNVTYQNTCLICKKDGKETIYIGETYRSLSERHSEHVGDWLDNKDESHMQKHATEAHSGQADFQIKILKSHKTAISRQISETVAIKCKTLEGATLLNSKTEYNRCLLPELTVEIGKDKKSEEEAR